jgi:rhomboid protease GluP
VSLNNLRKKWGSTVVDDEAALNLEPAAQTADASGAAQWQWASASITLAIIAMNLLVYIVMVIRGVSWIEPTAYNLLAWGADYGPLTLGGQWWRMFASLFLHFGIIHIAFNMWVLANIGPFMESVSGRISYLILYIVAGLGGGTASLVWHPTTVSAGASGAIFGLYGALLGFLLRHRRVIAPEALQSLRKGALVFVGYNLLFGFARPEVDVAAHVGGLCTGFALGLFLVRPPSRDSSSANGRNAIAAVLGVALVAGTVLALPKPSDLLGEFKRFAGTESKSISLLNASSERWKANQLSDQQFADIIEQQILPPWRAEREAIASLKHLPAKQATLTAALVNYMDTREHGWALLAEGARSGDGAKIRQAATISKQADQLAKQLGVGGK